MYGPSLAGGYNNGGGLVENGFTLNACGYSVYCPGDLTAINTPDDLVYVQGSGLGLISQDSLTNAILCTNFIQLNTTRNNNFINSAYWPAEDDWSEDLLFIVTALNETGSVVQEDFSVYGSDVKGALGTFLCSGLSQLPGETFNMTASCNSTYTSYQYLSIQAGINGKSCPATCQSMYLTELEMPCNADITTICDLSPTATPTLTPTAVPTSTPTVKPPQGSNGFPTVETDSPTARPTKAPTAHPTRHPTTYCDVQKIDFNCNNLRDSNETLSFTSKGVAPSPSEYIPLTVAAFTCLKKVCTGPSESQICTYQYNANGNKCDLWDATDIEVVHDGLTKSSGDTTTIFVQFDLEDSRWGSELYFQFGGFDCQSNDDGQKVKYFTSHLPLSSYSSLPSSVKSASVCDGFYLDLSSCQRYVTFALTCNQYIKRVEKLCHEPTCTYVAPPPLPAGCHEETAHFTCTEHQFAIGYYDYYNRQSDFLGHLQNAVDCNLQGRCSLAHHTCQQRSFAQANFVNHRNLQATSGIAITYNVEFVYPATGNADVDAQTLQTYYSLLTAQYAANISTGALTDALQQFCTYANDTDTCMVPTTALPAFSGPYAGASSVSSTSGSSDPATSSTTMRSIIIAVVITVVLLILAIAAYCYYRSRRTKKVDYPIDLNSSFDGFSHHPTDDHRDSFVGSAPTQSAAPSRRSSEPSPRAGSVAVGSSVPPTPRSSRQNGYWTSPRQISLESSI